MKCEIETLRHMVWYNESNNWWYFNFCEEIQIRNWSEYSICYSFVSMCYSNLAFNLWIFIFSSFYSVISVFIVFLIFGILKYNPFSHYANHILSILCRTGQQNCNNSGSFPLLLNLFEYEFLENQSGNSLIYTDLCYNPCNVLILFIKMIENGIFLMLVIDDTGAFICVFFSFILESLVDTKWG